MGPSPPRLAMLDQPGPVEDCMDRIHAGHVVELLGNDLPEFSSAPAAVAAELEDPRDNLTVGAVGTGVGPVGSVGQALETFFLVAPDPLAGSGAADPVATGGLADGVEPLLGFEDEADSLVHDACGSPRHRGILQKGKCSKDEGKNCKRSALNVPDIPQYLELVSCGERPTPWSLHQFRVRPDTFARGTSVPLCIHHQSPSPAPSRVSTNEAYLVSLGGWQGAERHGPQRP